MVDKIASDSSESAQLLVVGSVAFDNVITPYGSQEGILGGALPTAHLPQVTSPNLEWLE